MDYSYIREEFNKNQSNNYILSIQLDPDGFSVYATDKESISKPLYFLSKRFEKPGIASLTQGLKDFVEFDNNTFHKTIIIYHSSKFCLIPNELYNPDTQADYLRLTHSLSDKECIFYSDIQGINAKVVFCLPKELNTLITSKFPSAILLHSACATLNFGIQKSEKTCIIYHYGTSISIAVFDRKELKLFNIFSVHDQNDFVYYILNSLKSCNQKIAETIFYFLGGGEVDSEKYKLHSKYITKPVYYIPELKGVNTLDFPVNMLFNHLEGLYCVS